MDKEDQNWTPEEQDLFEKYLLEGMTAREKAEFESRLQSEPDFRAQFLIFRKMFRAVEEAGLRRKVADFHRIPEEDTQLKRLSANSYRSYFRMAAAVALLIALGGLWFLVAPGPNEKLYQEYYSPDPGLPTVMGNSANYAFYEAMVDYKQGEYQLALEKWEKLRSKQPENDTLNYFLGSAYLASGDADRAIPFFDRVLSSDPGAFQNESAFYNGMAHLKNKQIAAARKYLEQSASEKGRVLARKLKD